MLSSIPLTVSSFLCFILSSSNCNRHVALERIFEKVLFLVSLLAWCATGEFCNERGENGEEKNEEIEELGEFKAGDGEGNDPWRYLFYLKVYQNYFWDFEATLGMICMSLAHSEKLEALLKAFTMTLVINW